MASFRSWTSFCSSTEILRRISCSSSSLRIWSNLNSSISAFVLLRLLPALSKSTPLPFTARSASRTGQAKRQTSSLTADLSRGLEGCVDLGVHDNMLVFVGWNLGVSSSDYLVNPSRKRRSCYRKYDVCQPLPWHFSQVLCIRQVVGNLRVFESLVLHRNNGEPLVKRDIDVPQVVTFHNYERPENVTARPEHLHFDLPAMRSRKK